MFNSHFCCLQGHFSDFIGGFRVSDVSSLHLGDRFFLEELCFNLNSMLSVQSGHKEINLSLKKHGLAPGEELGCLLDFSRFIFILPEVDIALSLKNVGISVDPFSRFRNNSRVIVNSEVDSSRLRILGLGSKFDQVQTILSDNAFDLSYIGALDKRNKYSESISGLVECKAFIDDIQPDFLLSFDNFWMHYCLSLGMPVFVVQRHKALRRNLINHLVNLNTICGKEVYYVN